MYRLLVVDDEQIMIDSIKYIVKNNFTNISVNSARSGRDAIEKAEDFLPDMVFMDIKMPGINGIDAIKEIQTISKNVKFVIISAYEYFEIARDAIELGVVSYITKPVSKETIINSVKAMIEKIEFERDRRKRELELKDKFNKVIPVLENGFIYSLIFFENNSKEQLYYKNFFQIEQNGGLIITIEFGENETMGDMTNKIGVSIKSQKFYPFITEILKSTFACFIGPIMLNRIIVFVPQNPEEDEYMQRLAILKKVESIYNKISEHIDVDFCIGIGKIYNEYKYLRASYSDSLIAIKYLNGKGFIHITDVPEEILNQKDLANEKPAFENFGKANGKKLSVLISKAKEYIFNNYSKELTLEEAAKHVNISPYYFSKLFKEEVGENFIDYLTSIRINNAKDLLANGGYSIKEICYLIGYGDPNYFSRIFKKIEGISPSEYKEMISRKHETL